MDSHAHLEMAEFDADRDAVLERARQAGVTGIVAISSGSGPGRLEAAIPFAETHDWIWATIGIHPHEAQEATDGDFDRLVELARHPRVVAWGEIGLDYHYDHSPRETQRQVFRRQLELARAAKLPVILHCREAWPDALEILGADWAATGLGGIFHCFTGTLEDAWRGIEMGFLVSFAANLTYPKAEGLRAVAAQVPLGRLLIETDSPFLPPQGRRGRRNEPAFVVEVAKTLGSVRDLTAEEIARITAANLRRLFRLAAPSPGRPAAEDSPSLS
ncbi:MAG TPA: TatD family hydrolase [Candidatus Acidoferrales bacterium]|nr:TatD family hydrolase [Candidatus Acidoferrales bacterium]